MSWSPRFHPKVTAGVFASYVTVCGLYAAAAGGYHIDGVLGSAIDGILTTLFAYWMPSDDQALTPDALEAILSRFQPTHPGDNHEALPVTPPALGTPPAGV